MTGSVPSVEIVALFNAGVDQLVLEALRRSGHRVELQHQDESCLVFWCERTVKPSDMLWAKNYFTVLTATSRGSLPKVLGRLAGQVPENLDAGRAPRQGFRVVVHVDGKLTSVDTGARGRLEAALHHATGARVSQRGGGTEFWVLARRQSSTVWLARRAPKHMPPSPRGSLAPELASLLCLASEPSPGDVFLDPFAGSGAISLARLSWAARSIYASDQQRIAWPRGRKPSRIETFTQDVRGLATVIPQAISVVVTDPPWNEFAQVSHHGALLAEACNGMAEMAASSGLRVVALINRRGAEQLQWHLRSAGFGQVGEVEILVNGHPASVLTARL